MSCFASAAHDAAETGQTMHDRVPARYHTSWSTGRLSAVLATTRNSQEIDQLQRDEQEFFAAEGVRRDVDCGVVLARSGQVVTDVHLIDRGAAAILGELGERRPILALTVAGELCGAVPALLGEAVPWDVVTVNPSSILSMPAERFVAAVRERWADRWSTRVLTWLAEVGVQNHCLERTDLGEEVAAFLLQHPQVTCGHASCRALADVLDVGAQAIRQVVDRFAQRGALRVVGDQINVTNTDVLRALAS